MNSVDKKWRHPLFAVWWAMKNRCYSRKSISYKNYGAKGVKVCDEWRNNYNSFFDWAMNNGWEKGLQLDKDMKAKKMGIAPDLYSPDRCVFVTRSANNLFKDNSIYLEYKGQKKHIAEWALEFKIHKHTLYNRIFVYGMSVEDSFTKKLKKVPNLYEYNGETLSVTEWSKKLNLHKNTIRHRIKTGVDIKYGFSSCK